MNPLPRFRVRPHTHEGKTLLVLQVYTTKHSRNVGYALPGDDFAWVDCTVEDLSELANLNFVMEAKP